MNIIKVISKMSSLQLIKPNLCQIDKVISYLEQNPTSKSAKGLTKSIIAAKRMLRNETKLTQIYSNTLQEINNYLNEQQFDVKTPKSLNYICLMKDIEDQQIQIIIFPRERLFDTSQLTKDKLSYFEIDKFNEHFNIAYPQNLESKLIPFEKDLINKGMVDMAIDQNNPFGVDFQDLNTLNYLINIKKRSDASNFLIQCQCGRGQCTFKNLIVFDNNEPNLEWEQEIDQLLKNFQEQQTFDFYNLSDVQQQKQKKQKPFQTEFVSYLNTLGLTGKEAYIYELISTHLQQMKLIKYLENVHNTLTQNQLMC